MRRRTENNASVATGRRGRGGWIKRLYGAWCDLPYSADIIATRIGGPDLTVWNYQVNNTSTDTGYTLWLVAIQVDADNDVLSVSVPTGWSANPNDPLSPPNLISWMSDTADIPAGGFIDTFQATYASKPLSQDFSVMFENVETGDSGLVEAPSL